MTKPKPLQWYCSKADIILPDGPLKVNYHLQIFPENFLPRIAQDDSKLDPPQMKTLLPKH
jgi:hypothetical protein